MRSMHGKHERNVTFGMKPSVKFDSSPPVEIEDFRNANFQVKTDNFNSITSTESPRFVHSFVHIFFRTVKYWPTVVHDHATNRSSGPCELSSTGLLGDAAHLQLDAIASTKVSGDVLPIGDRSFVLRTTNLGSPSAATSLLLTLSNQTCESFFKFKIENFV